MTLKSLSLSLAMILTPMTVFAADAPNAPSTGKRIVGGVEATEGDWPWMSALVFTYNDVITETIVNGNEYVSLALSNSPGGDAEGLLMDCGLGDTQCDADGKVCLIERGEINFSEKALNCEAGGGVAAIIYNKDGEEGHIYGTLGDNFTGGIPVVGVKREDGVQMLTMLDTTASVSVAEEETLLQSSSCGSSFLGDRWVLTAAHCVDGLTADRVKINVGEYDLRDGAENAIVAKNVYMHADYDRDSLDNDIALVELSESVDSPAISLASAETTSLVATENSPATVIGWGGRKAYEPGQGPTSDFPDILHQVELQLFTNDECKEILADSRETTTDNAGITENMICAGTTTGGKGSCQGDSGGPLVVQTGNGWEQVGVVSWGIGCAVQGYPGVYARVASFHQWLTAIQEGIAIQQNLYFGVTAVNTPIEKSIAVTNNSGSDANLTFSIEGETLSLDSSDCSTLAKGQSCEVKVTYTPTEAGDVAAYLTVESDNEEIEMSRALVTGTAVAAADELESELSNNDAIKWFSGGDQIWRVSSKGGLRSGVIEDEQRSILLAQVTGEGTFTFEWSVSSEENAADPSSPYDALYLYVNGELIDFISGVVDYVSYDIELEDGVNNIYWIYEKDQAESDNSDAGFVRNVTFTGGTVTTPTTPEVTPPTNENARKSSSGGFGMSWLLLFAPALVALRRRR